MAHRQGKLTVDEVARKLGRTPQFLFHAAEVAPAQYQLFDLPKRTGGVRTICTPKNDLKRLQRAILEDILWDFEMPEHVHGCVRGRSIATNALPHVNKPVVLTLDLKDFFGSISPDLVRAIFKEHFDCDKEAADLLTALTTYGTFLPQGAPSSPTLANIAALPVDREILEICQESELQCDYTRYVDDITISGDNKLAVLLGPFHRAIVKHGFAASPDKLRAALPAGRQKVTGVIVNKKMSPPKKLIRRIRQKLYYCEKYGLENHCENQGIASDQFLREFAGMMGFMRLTVPDMVDEFECRIRRLVRFNPVLDNEEIFNALKHAIEEELNVKFKYERGRVQAAPAELYIDDDGRKFLRAFEIFPGECWQRYYFDDISEVEVIEYE